MKGHIRRMKARLLDAPYEICLARARHFTDVYRETEGMDPALRNAMALQRTLQRQEIRIEPDERLAGSKTERFLAGALSVERGDFLRVLQMELDILERKKQPFHITAEDRHLFREEIFSYWSGRTVRDRKAEEWRRRGVVDVRSDLQSRLAAWSGGLRLLRHMNWDVLKRAMGANLGGPLSLRRLKDLHELRHEWAYNNPTPALYCFDVQGHLCLGVDKVVSLGMEHLVERTRRRLEELEVEAPEDAIGRAFLEAVIISLEAAVEYSERFAERAIDMATQAKSPEEEARLEGIAEACRRVPRLPPRTFREALQAMWMAQLVGEIQYGTHDVFAPGRIDQFLLPFYRSDIEAGHLDRPEALSLLQEMLLKLSANVEPIPEPGMESNGVLGNSQHCVTVGGCSPNGSDATNELSELILDAYEDMNGAVNQLCVRIHPGTAPGFLRRAAQVFRRTSGLAFYNDEAVCAGLRADGMSTEDARDYCIVGCVETSGQSNTHGCPGGHELVLPAVLMMTLTRGRVPSTAPGQHPGADMGDPALWTTFEHLLSAFRRQLTGQLDILEQAVVGKDLAHRELLPAPYVSALMDGCIGAARDITAGGAKYDFTSVDVRGLGTLVDSLLAIRQFVYERGLLSLEELTGKVLSNFEEDEVLRQRILGASPKYGTGDPEADRLAQDVVDWVHTAVRHRRNIRGGRFRSCYYSYGNHVLDGFLVGATPDGRPRGEPISNGCSPSNQAAPVGGPLGSMSTAARLPPEKVSSGVSLNIRFHPSFLTRERGLDAFTAMLRAYFDQGGMHVQPNVVSTETLRAAQRDPERYRDLVVKVSGYSAYFTDLGGSIQQDIIDRVEFQP